MHLPPRFPGLRLITFLMAIYAVIWVSLEGRLERAILMGVGVTAVSLLHLLQKRFGGQSLSLKKWLQITAVFGLFSGLASGPSTLIAMILKTGLHTHGPEFSQAELQWTIQQIPLWAIVGLLMGVGIGMLTSNHR